MLRMNGGFAFILLAVSFLAFHASPLAFGAEAPLSVTASVNSKTIPPYEVFEITFQHDTRYGNPFSDVVIEVAFVSPRGEKRRVGGFHYGSLEKPRIKALGSQGKGGAKVEYAFDKANIWKARFAPGELGQWTYSYTFASAKGEKAIGNGAFSCVQGHAANPGFVRHDPRNPMRWVFDDGSPFYPIGLQNGLFDGDATGTALDAIGMEGPFRLDRKGRPDPPPGAMFKPGPSNNPQNADVFFRTFGKCGFNLLRFSQQNNTLSLNTNLERYGVQEGIMVDEYLQCARKYGFRVFYGIFGFQSAFNNKTTDTAAMDKVKRFIKYSVDRWGACVDFWEFLNEQKADARWYAIMAPYLRSIDPYRHPITTSWERPELPGIEVNAPHWYVNVGKIADSDLAVVQQLAKWKRHGKPVIVGETGNHTTNDLSKRPPGVGGVWDPESSRRMRVRNWTAFFKELAFIYWDTSYAKDGHYMNMWFGPQERQYVKAMQDFAYCLGGGLSTAPVALAPAKAARGYALASDSRVGVYLLNASASSASTASSKSSGAVASVTVTVPKAGKGYWYSPENGAVLAAIDAPAGEQVFSVPSFATDIALVIGTATPPDSDHDGKSNDVDEDDDNDGVPDAKDAFPLDPSEWADKDGDLIGDNLDADVDADGIGDDKNGNGAPDNEEPDVDKDGVPTAHAVPWDAFPLDPKEWRDTDGDGVGDNADPDKDGDGFSDAEEVRAGTDPLNRLSFPVPR